MKPYYDHGGIQIFHGDCREILPTVTADVLVTDPPYGVAFNPRWNNKFQGERIANDESTSARDSVLEWWGVDKPALVFGSWKAERPKSVRQLLIWDMGTVGAGDISLPWFPCIEDIYVIGSGFVGTRTSAVYRYVNKKQDHPNEKPLRLMCELISKCPAGTVLDPFMESGTTLVAAKELGRRAIGIEIEEKYCEVAAKRLSQQVLSFEPAKPAPQPQQTGMFEQDER